MHGKQNVKPLVLVSTVEDSGDSACADSTGGEFETSEWIGVKVITESTSELELIGFVTALRTTWLETVFKQSLF